MILEVVEGPESGRQVKLDGGPFGPEDVMRAQPFADLTVTALDIDPSAMPSLGSPTLLGRSAAPPSA